MLEGLFILLIVGVINFFWRISRPENTALEKTDLTGDADQLPSQAEGENNTSPDHESGSPRLASVRPAFSPSVVFFEKDGRFFFDATLLADLNNELADILVPDDDLRVFHRTLGEGKVVGVRKRPGIEAIIDISFIKNPEESGSFASRTFASPFFRGDGLLASIQIEEPEKLRKCFSKRIDEARKKKNEVRMSLSSDRGRINEIKYSRQNYDAIYENEYYWQDDNEYEEIIHEEREERRREEEEAGFSWYDYHKHD